MTVLQGALRIVACVGVGFAIGGGTGLIVALFAPDFIQLFFRPGEAGLAGPDLRQVALGLGVTNGVIFGAIIGTILTLIEVVTMGRSRQANTDADTPVQ